MTPSSSATTMSPGLTITPPQLTGLLTQPMPSFPPAAARAARSAPPPNRPDRPAPVLRRRRSECCADRDSRRWTSETSYICSLNTYDGGPALARPRAPPARWREPARRATKPHGQGRVQAAFAAAVHAKAQGLGVGTASGDSRGGEGAVRERRLRQRDHPGAGGQGRPFPN